MKHIFWVHSHLTYLIAIKIVELNKLKKEDGLLLCTRNYFPDKNSKIESIQFPFYYDPNDPNKKVFVYDDHKKTRENINRIHKMINTKINHQNFNFYIAGSKFDFISSIIQMKNCMGYYYIEEGLSQLNVNYYIDSNLKVKIKELIKQFIPHKLESYKEFKYLLKPFFYNGPKLLGTIGVTEKSFKYLKGSFERIVLNPFKNKQYELDTKNNISYDCVIVFDALVSYGKLNNEDFLFVIQEKIIPFIIKKEYKSVAFKFHPQQYDNELNEIIPVREMFAKYLSEINLIELDKDVIIEKILSQGKIDVIGFVSSILYYAALLGCTAYSVVEYLEKNNMCNFDLSEDFREDVFDKWKML